MRPRAHPATGEATGNLSSLAGLSGSPQPRPYLLPGGKAVAARAHMRSHLVIKRDLQFRSLELISADIHLRTAPLEAAHCNAPQAVGILCRGLARQRAYPSAKSLFDWVIDCASFQLGNIGAQNRTNLPVHSPIPEFVHPPLSRSRPVGT